MKKKVLTVLIVSVSLIFIFNTYSNNSGTILETQKQNGKINSIMALKTAEALENTREAAGRPVPYPVDLLTDVEINGCKQKILVQADDLNNPVLLYIHGGPGDPAMMYSHLYSELLRKNFIFVNWDQRGSGLSWHEGMDASKISERQIFDDALELTGYLIKAYKKDKIYIIGHSFGSIIGLRLAYRHPEFYHAYIGVGQVLDWNRSVVLTKDWLKSKMLEAGDFEGLEKLENESVPNMDEVIQYGGHTHTKIDFDSIMKASPYYFQGYIDLKNKAREFVQNCIGRNGSGDNLPFMKMNELKVPLFFFEGKYDHVTACAPELVVEYFNNVKAPAKELVWFENSAHLPNLEEPLRFQQMLIEKVLDRQK